MPLSAGTRLGHYDVTSLLGEGGMGQVWQATDTQLDRQVGGRSLSARREESPLEASWTTECTIVFATAHVRGVQQVASCRLSSPG